MGFMLQQQSLVSSELNMDTRAMLNQLTKEQLIDFILAKNLEEDEMLMWMLNKKTGLHTTRQESIENNKLIAELKKLANQLWIVYDNSKERIFAHHINTAKEFWNVAERYWLTRLQYALAVMQSGKLINSFFRYAGPKDIYQNHAKIVNEFERKKNEFGNKKPINKVSKKVF